MSETETAEHAEPFDGDKLYQQRARAALPLLVRQELAEDGQTVSGVIIAYEDDQRIRRALTMTPNIVFYRYQVSFKLMKG